MSTTPEQSVDPARFVGDDDLERRMETLFSALLGFRPLPSQVASLTTSTTTLTTSATALTGRVTTLEGAVVPSPLTITTGAGGTVYRLTKSGGGGGLQVVVSPSLYAAANPIAWTFPSAFSAVPVVIGMVIAGSINIAQAENVTVNGADLVRWEWTISPAGWGGGVSYSVLALAVGIWGV